MSESLSDYPFLGNIEEGKTFPFANKIETLCHTNAAFKDRDRILSVILENKTSYCKMIQEYCCEHKIQNNILKFNGDRAHETN